jgi:UDP-N-acetylmuramoyl-L-alanyl-D-glutamate--2,6-diaminopimelate ligase
MGRAARIADEIVLTNDNPRHEDPATIAAEIRCGIGDHPGVTVILDREEAIWSTIEQLQSADVVVIAGRGPETHQVFAAGIRRLVDAEVVRCVLGLPLVCEERGDKRV